MGKITKQYKSYKKMYAREMFDTIYCKLNKKQKRIVKRNYNWVKATRDVMPSRFKIPC